MDDYCFSFAQLPVRTLAPGIRAHAVIGQRLMATYCEFVPRAASPEHSHPHEQVGICLAGEMEFEIGGKRQRIKAGDGFYVPSNVVHRAWVMETGAITLEVFSPPREDYIALPEEPAGQHDPTGTAER